MDFFLKYKAKEEALSQVGLPGTAVGESPVEQGMCGRGSRMSPEHHRKAEMGQGAL